MCRRISAAVAALCERQQELVGLPEIGVAATASLHADETKGFGFTDGWGYAVVMYAIIDKVLLGDWQVAVVIAAVVGELDLDPRDDPVRGHAQHAVCCRTDSVASGLLRPLNNGSVPTTSPLARSWSVATKAPSKSCSHRQCGVESVSRPSRTTMRACRFNCKHV